MRHDSESGKSGRSSTFLTPNPLTYCNLLTWSRLARPGRGQGEAHVGLHRNHPEDWGQAWPGRLNSPQFERRRLNDGPRHRRLWRPSFAGARPKRSSRSFRIPPIKRRAAPARKDGPASESEIKLSRAWEGAESGRICAHGRLPAWSPVFAPAWPRAWLRRRGRARLRARAAAGRRGRSGRWLRRWR